MKGLGIGRCSEAHNIGNGSNAIYLHFSSICKQLRNSRQVDSPRRRVRVPSLGELGRMRKTIRAPNAYSVQHAGNQTHVETRSASETLPVKQ